MMLYIMFAYLLLFAALSNAVCMYNAFFSFFAIDFCKCFLFHALSWFISSMIFHHARAFNLLVFPNSMFTPFFI